MSISYQVHRGCLLLSDAMYVQRELAAQMEYQLPDIKCCFLFVLHWFVKYQDDEQ